VKYPHKFYTAVFCALFIGLLVSCQRSSVIEPLRFSGSTMGTTWSVVLVPQQGQPPADLTKLLQQRLDQINQRMSTYDPESEVSRFNRYQGRDWFSVSTETAEVIGLALKISRLTAGAFDISVGPLVDLWGFGPTVAATAHPDQDQIDQRLASVGYEKLDVRQTPAAIRKSTAQLHIDLSAIAKGFAVDQLAQLLLLQGIDNFLVEVGGELQVFGTRADGSPWRVAIERPLEGVREVERVLPLSGTALATSGNYRNFYIDENGQRYAHTIDPVSGRPIFHKLASATVLDPSCARADALATALMVMGEERGRKLVEENAIAALLLINEGEQLIDYASPAYTSFIGKESP
jgi:thiamine biosynthesis lipoprotein